MWCEWTVISKKSPTVLLCSVMFLGLMGCVGIGGTQIHLAHDTLSTPNQNISESIHMQKFAEDRRETNWRIGHATLRGCVICHETEIGDLTTTDPITVEVVMQVKQALERIGYQVTLVDLAHPAPNPPSILKVNIKEFYFKNDNLFWPLVPTWGSIELELTIENSLGKVLYEKSFSGSGNSYCLTGECAFGTAMKEAMTEVLNKIVEECSGEVFHQAIKT
jgi:hypothetical protein